MRTFVGSQCQQDHPFAFVGQERSYAVLAHIRSYGYRIYVQFFEESTGIHGGSVSYIATLCIGNDELVGIIIFDIFYCLFKGNPTFHAHAFIESEVWLVSNAQVGCCVDDSFVESEDRIFFLQQMFGYFLDVGIKSYAKE